jgi:hypothetical protein
MNQWASDNSALISMINTFGMIALTGIYVIFTVLIQRANKKVVEQNDIIRKENNMPNVIVYFDMKIFNMLDLKIKNIGKTPACNIKVSLEPQNEIVNVRYLERSSLLNGIAFLAPSQSLKTMLGTLMELENSNGDFPKYKVVINYTDSEGSKFSNEYFIDANMYKGNVQVVDKTIHDLTKEVDKTNKILEKISRNIAELKPDGDGQ